MMKFQVTLGSGSTGTEAKYVEPRENSGPKISLHFSLCLQLTNVHHPRRPFILEQQAISLVVLHI